MQGLARGPGGGGRGCRAAAWWWTGVEEEGLGGKEEEEEEDQQQQQQQHASVCKLMRKADGKFRGARNELPEMRSAGGMSSKGRW